MGYKKPKKLKVGRAIISMHIDPDESDESDNPIKKMMEIDASLKKHGKRPS